MKILIDADGCPVVKETISIGQKNHLEVVVVKNYAHQIHSDYATIVTVDKSADRADFIIANRVETGDIVITQDYGLCSMVIAKGGICINQFGKVIDSTNIDGLLDRRHLNRHIRMTQGKYTKHKKRSSADTEAFVATLKSVLGA